MMTAGRRDGGSGGDGGSGDDDGSGDGGDGGVDNNATGDDDDFGDIIGDKDFDPDMLDDIVSLGDCVMETESVGAVAPDDSWFCTVLDSPIPGFDGFTKKSPDSELDITFGSPSPFGACDGPGICENLTAVDIPGFSDAMKFDQFGVAGGINGSHDEYGIELVVTKAGLLTDEEVALVGSIAATLTML
jgi:hypothetical protein